MLAGKQMLGGGGDVPVDASIRLQNDPMKPCPNYQIRKGFQSMSPNSFYLGRNSAFWSNDVVDVVLAFAVAVVFAAVAVVVADIVSLDLAHVIALAHAVVYFSYHVIVLLLLLWLWLWLCLWCRNSLSETLRSICRTWG